MRLVIGHHDRLSRLAKVRFVISVGCSLLVNKVPYKLAFAVIVGGLYKVMV